MAKEIKKCSICGRELQRVKCPQCGSVVEHCIFNDEDSLDVVSQPCWNCGYPVLFAVIPKIEIQPIKG